MRVDAVQLWEVHVVAINNTCKFIPEFEACSHFAIIILCLGLRRVPVCMLVTVHRSETSTRLFLLESDASSPAVGHLTRG